MLQNMEQQSESCWHEVSTSLQTLQLSPSRQPPVTQFSLPASAPAGAEAQQSLLPPHTWQTLAHRSAVSQ